MEQPPDDILNPISLIFRGGGGGGACPQSSYFLDNMTLYPKLQKLPCITLI